MANPETTHPRNPRGVEITISPNLIEQVFKEWEAANAGQRAHLDMDKDEFAKRVMEKIRSTARIIPDA